MTLKNENILKEKINIRLSEKIKNLIAKITLSVSVFILILFTIEYVLDILGYKQINQNFEVKYVHIEDWRFFHMYKDRHFSNDHDLLWKGNKQMPGFNSSGFHCREFSVKKPPNVVRVFCVGDSNTLGNFKYAYPEMLDKLLNSSQSKIKYEVYNLGIYGYSSEQGVIVLKKTIKYKPDFVILNFGWNDAVLVQQFNDREFMKRYKKSKFFIIYVLSRFRLYNFLRILSYKLAKKRPLKPRVDLSRFKSNYTDIVKLCMENNITLIIVSRAQFKPDSSTWRATIPDYNNTAQTVADDHNIKFINAEKFINGKPCFVDECHYSYRGYSLLNNKLSLIIRNSK